MAKEISEDTVVGLSLKTIGAIIAAVGVVTLGYFDLQAGIEEAKALPEPVISRTEYDLKDQMIRNSILNTEEKVEKLEEKVDDIKDDTRSINETLLNMNNK